MNCQGEPCGKKSPPRPSLIPHHAKRGKSLPSCPRYRLKLSFHMLLLKPLRAEELHAGVYRLGIIEAAPVLRDFLQGFIYTQGQSLRLAGGHDVNKVGHS